MNEIFNVANLRQAWERTLESDGCAGADGVSLEWFADNIEEELELLSRELSSGTYQPLPLTRFFVPKADGGKRPLCVLTVRDRIAQNAVINVIAPVFESEFEACSFAYRKGRSVQQALQQVVALQEQGYVWVVDADISAFFDNVNHSLLLDRVREIVPEAHIIRLIELWLKAKIYDGQLMTEPTKGVPQGSPLSPMLANLYLDTFDEQMLADGQKLVRFADDFLILCKSKPKAEAALQLTKKVLTGLELALNEDKTRITDFAAGFKFLGAEFIHNLCLVPLRGSKKNAVHAPVQMPPPLPLLRIRPTTRTPFNPALKAALQFAAMETPDLFTRQSFNPPFVESSSLPAASSPFPPPKLSTLRTLYLHEHGTVLRCEDEHLRVSKDDVELADFPAFKIDLIVLFGNTQITTPAMKFCLSHNIPVILLSGRGEYFGSIETTNSENVLLHQQQFARYHEVGFALEVARSIVAGKIANCRALLQRRQRGISDKKIARAIDAMLEIKGGLLLADTIDEVRGYEGAASKAYFEGLNACLSPPFTLAGRNRRPPLDPVNALLSFGYTLLFYNIYALVKGRGLAPYVGSLHELRQGHPALCSDLIEEFRAPVVDGLVTSVLNKKIIKPGDFYYAETSSGARGCFLADAARKAFVAQFEERINTVVMHPGAGIQTTWRGCIDLQVGHYIKVVRGEIPAYQPLEIR